MSKHTTQLVSRKSRIFFGDPDSIATHVIDVGDDARAAHIVKCVNLHDELVEALQSLVFLPEDPDRVTAARAALAKAKGGA
jgi:hypothetical protein